MMGRRGRLSVQWWKKQRLTDKQRLRDRLESHMTLLLLLLMELMVMVMVVMVARIFVGMWVV